MKNLWAPWRIEYIHSSAKGCFFCKGLNSKNPKKVLIIERSAKAFTIMNRFPYNSGHLMIAPVRHIGALQALDDQEILEINRLLVRAIKAVKIIMKPQGFNIGINQGEVAGAGIVDHIHIHLVPRWQGDTNFMPVLANTKVVIESLDENYKRIKNALLKMDKLQ